MRIRRRRPGVATGARDDQHESNNHRTAQAADSRLRPAARPRSRGACGGSPAVAASRLPRPDRVTGGIAAVNQMPIKGHVRAVRNALNMCGWGVSIAAMKVTAWAPTTLAVPPD